MKPGNIPRTTAEALDALRAEAQTGLPLDAQSRLAARLQSAVMMGGCFSGTAAHVSQVTDLAGAPLPNESGPAVVDRLAALLGSHPVASLAITLSLGAIAGAAVHATVTHRESAKLENARIVAHTASSALPMVAPPRSDAPVSAIADLPLIAAHESGVHALDARRAKQSAVEPASSAAPKSSASMAEQLAMLERARAALGQGDGNGALRILGEHGREYPKSPLSEEREALTVKALARVGRVEQAKARLAEFEARFPGSLMLPALKSAVVAAGSGPRSTHPESW